MAKPKRKRKVDQTGRSINSGKFVKLDGWLLNSAAYRLLSPAARALLVEFMLLYNGGNNGLLFMSQRDAARVLGLKTHSTAGKYLKELVDRGFLRVRVQGSFSNKTQQATIYALTMFEAFGQDATKDFMKLKLTDAEKRRVKKMEPSWRNNRPVGWEIPPGIPDNVAND